jgi:hypothetical protein
MGPGGFFPIGSYVLRVAIREGEHGYFSSSHDYGLVCPGTRFGQWFGGRSIRECIVGADTAHGLEQLE